MLTKIDTFIIGQPGAGNSGAVGEIGNDGNASYFSSYYNKNDIDTEISNGKELSNNPLYNKKDVSYGADDIVCSVDGSVGYLDSGLKFNSVFSIFNAESSEASSISFTYEKNTSSETLPNRYYADVSIDGNQAYDKYMVDNNEKTLDCSLLTLTFSGIEELSNVFVLHIVLTSGFKLKYTLGKKNVSENSISILIPKYYFERFSVNASDDISSCYIEILNTKIKTIYGTPQS